MSANTASEDEIAAALESAGVSNPERWAEEVVEYRPYPADDPNLTKLRDEPREIQPGAGDDRQDRLCARAVSELLSPPGTPITLLVRRGLVALTVVSILATAFELAAERHWNGVEQTR